MGNIPYKDGYMDAVVQIKRLTDRNADLEADLAEARERVARAELQVADNSHEIAALRALLTAYEQQCDNADCSLCTGAREYFAAPAAESDRPPSPLELRPDGEDITPLLAREVYKPTQLYGQLRAADRPRDGAQEGPCEHRGEVRIAEVYTLDENLELIVTSTVRCEACDTVTLEQTLPANR
jgi:hypothetical protein